MNYGMQQAGGGRHLASRRAKGPSGWVLAPGVLALVAMVLFILALMGNLGPQGLSTDGAADQAAAPDARPAQALPSDGASAEAQQAEGQQTEAPAQDENVEPAAAAVQLVGVANVDGDQLGDIATYDDGVMACVSETRHEDAGQGLAKVTITAKIANGGSAPLDASTALVELGFAQQSSRATLIDGERFGVLEPGAEATAEWSFRMPADQIDDISVTLAPSDGHEKATFHGASR
jgi:hypothetical protein